MSITNHYNLSQFSQSAYAPSEDLEETRNFEEAKKSPRKYLCSLYYNSAEIPILTQLHRFEIAKLCAQQDAEQDAEKIADCIQDFDLTQEQRFEMAKLCAPQNSSATARHIKKFDLTESQRFEVAKLCAKKNGIAPAQYIENFDLSKSEQRFEVAKLCIQQWVRQNYGLGILTAYDFNLTNPQICEILNSTIPQYSSSWSWISSQKVQGYDVLSYFENKDSLEAFIDRIFGFSIEGFDAVTIASVLKTIEEPEQQKAAIKLTASALSNWREIFTTKQLTSLSLQAYLEDILALRAPYLRTKLIKLVEETAKIEIAAKAAKMLSPFREISVGLPPLLQLPLAKLLVQGVDISSLKFNQHALRDSAIFIPFLESMIEFANDANLTAVQKTDIIRALSQNPIALARNLLMILNFGRGDLLQTSLSRGLPNLAAEAFRSVLPMPEVEDFSELYEDTFDSYREKDALKIYAANLNKVGEYRPALESLGAHVFSVLNGTYRSERYDTAKNPHLQFLEERRAGILKAWQQNSIESLQLGEASATSHSMREWLYEKLITDKHMDFREYPLLQEFLQAKGSADSGAKAKLQTAKMALRDPSKQKELSNINLQLKCILLSKSPNEQESLRLLKEIEKLVEASEFKNDIAAKITALTQTQKNLSGHSIIETDDPEDLLLCGTEIRGSCQRVDGDPSLTRGLVGYLRNGQTRLIAVKDKAHRLVARCLLRLLTDGEKPVLFLERFYSNLNEPRIYDAIVRKAKQAAKRLQCPLTSLEGKVNYGKLLQSLGGLAPCEYVDGAGGVKASQYTIENARLVYNPQFDEVKEQE